MNSHTWKILDLSSESKPLGHKWIFKRNMKVDDTINKYKVKFVIKGFRQQESVNYFDTYLYVSKIISIQH